MHGALSDWGDEQCSNIHSLLRAATAVLLLHVLQPNLLSCNDPKFSNAPPFLQPLLIDFFSCLSVLEQVEQGSALPLPDLLSLTFPLLGDELQLYDCP